VTTYLTKEQIIEQQVATVAADAKADTDPGAVDDDDLAHMSPDKLRAFLNSGHAARLGIGAPRGTRRQR
jgi:hypothetical protein